MDLKLVKIVENKSNLLALAMEDVAKPREAKIWEVFTTCLSAAIVAIFLL